MNPAALNSTGTGRPAGHEVPWPRPIRVRPDSLSGGVKDFSWREPTPSWPRSCALALFCVGGTILVELAVYRLGAELPSALLYLGTVLAAGWYGGVRAGLAATVAAALILQWSVLEPTHRFWVQPPQDVLQLTLFALEGLLISWLMQVLQQFRDDRAYSLACQKADKARAEGSEQRLRFALEAARMVAWEWDLDSNQIAYSSQGTNILDLAAESETVEAVPELVHPDDLPELTRAVQAALEGKEVYRTEFRIRKRGGGYLWVQDRGQVRRRRDGKPVRFTGVLLDITHRREAEEALRRSQEALQSANVTLRSILMAFPDVMFVVDMEGFIRMCNVSGERFLQALGSPTALPPSIEQPLQMILTGQPEPVQVSGHQVLGFRIDNQDRYYSLRIAPIQSQEGNPVGAAVVLQDVTEFRLLDEIKTNLLATVSHEVKNPLTSVQTALQVLQSQRLGQLTQTQEEMVRIAREESDRLLRTLNSLLDLTRFEESLTGMRYEPVSCDSLIDDALEETRVAATTAEVKLTPSVEDGLPEIEVDRQRVVRVLVNLVTNAVKYSPPGSEILVKARHAEANQVRISVQDQGPGIDPEHQHRLFDKFFRVPANTQSGVGLGLSIAREFVQAHGGTIGVTSCPGQGSEFHFLLPQRPPPASRPR